MNLNIPKRMQDIFDKHRFEINDMFRLTEGYQIEIGYQTSMGLYIEEAVVVNSLAVSVFIEGLNEICDNFDVTESAEIYYKNSQGDTIFGKEVGKDLKLNDFVEDIKEYSRHLYALACDLYENCPRIYSNGKDLKLIEDSLLTVEKE